MADLITRMRLDSAEYDQKLKRAQQNLLAFEQQCRSAGESMSSMSKENVEYVRALGNMETVSKNAKQRINELTQAFTELSIVYNRMSEEEKQGDVGKALSSSLDQLKARIGDAKKELNDVGRELGDVGNVSNETGGILESLAGKFGMNIKQLASWGTAIAAAKGALEVAKDAFFASEQNLDDWNRAVYASKSTYEAFLTSINTGDISGFLTRIDDIVKAATEAYNAMDALSTQKAINNSAVQAQQAENQRFRMMLMTRRWISAADGRSSGGMKDGQLLNDAQLKAIERMLENGMKTLTSYTQKEIHATTNAIEKLYDEQAKRLDMTRSEFLAGTKNYDIFSKNIEGANAYRNIEAQKDYLRNLANSGQNLTADQAAFLSQRNPYEQYRAWGVFKDDGELFNLINQYINQRAGLQSQVYGQMGQAYRAINRVEGITNRQGGGGGGKDTPEKLVEGGISGLKEFDIEAKGTTESMHELQAALKYFKDQLMTATTAAEYQSAKSGIASTERKIAAQPMALKFGMDAESMADIQEQMKAFGEELQSKIKPIKIPLSTEKTGEVVKDAESIRSSMSQAAGAISSVGSALQQIEDPGAKVAGIVATAIGTVASSFAQALGEDKTTKGNIWAFIAASAASTAAMITMISQINRVASYSEGGMIKGTSYSGDNIMANGGSIGVNAGEIILNKAQQGNLVSQMHGSAGTLRPSYISGEQIFVALNRYLTRSGHGELVTWQG